MEKDTVTIIISNRCGGAVGFIVHPAYGILDIQIPAARVLSRYNRCECHGFSQLTLITDARVLAGVTR